MKKLYKNKKYILIIVLVLIVLFITLTSNDTIIKLISSNIELKPKTDIENNVEESQTKIGYEVKETNGDHLTILIQIEDKRGIELIQTEDLVIKCNGKERISLDRSMNKDGIYQFKYKIIGMDKEEACTIIRPIPNIVITNSDTFGDKSTKTIEIEHINNENLKTCYSLDNGKTWQEYKEPLDIGIYENRQIIAKYEAKEGKTIQSNKAQYIVVPTESLLYATKNVIEESGYYRIAVLEEEYYAHVYVENTDKTLSSNIEYGDENDIATQTTDAKNMVIVKINGDLLINQNVTLTAHGNSYGGPKGMLLYVTGKLTNNGTITMSQRGAKAEGKNIYLWKNKIARTDNNGIGGEYEYVPNLGSTGGVGGTGGGRGPYYGNNGSTPTSAYGRTTGGGGGGAGQYSGYKGGNGGAGTSYSGGTGRWRRPEEHMELMVL